MAIIDHFGLIAPIYDRLIPFNSAKDWHELMELTARSRLLDAGGGTGRAAGALRPGIAQACVADISTEMLQRAASKPGLITVCSASEALPFPAQCFDGVIMVDSLHHVTDQSLTAGELWRVLKVGGILLIEEPDIRTFFIKILAFLEKLLLMRSHFLSPAQIHSLFEQFQAQIKIISMSSTAWVVIKRLA